MTKQEAVQLIDQAIARLQLTRNDHALLQQALQVIVDSQQPDGETTE